LIGQALMDSQDAITAVADLELSSHHLLQHIFDLLKKFPYQFPTVIAQVARKTDATFWRFIFSLAGNATMLFEVSIVSSTILFAGNRWGKRA